MKGTRIESHLMVLLAKLVGVAIYDCYNTVVAQAFSGVKRERRRKRNGDGLIKRF